VYQTDKSSHNPLQLQCASTHSDKFYTLVTTTNILFPHQIGPYRRWFWLVKMPPQFHELFRNRHNPGGKPSWLISRANLSATDQPIDLQCGTPVFQGLMSHKKQVFEECHSDIETFYEAASHFMTGNKEKGNSAESFFLSKNRRQIEVIIWLNFFLLLLTMSFVWQES